MNGGLENNYSHQLESSIRIQKAWRRYVYRKIFRYIKDILMNKLKNVNPWKLLKIMNPGETRLIESCVNMHIRFRLGGDNFPPQIYYKVYSNGNISDVNSYAPRNYAKIKSKYPKMSLKQYRIFSKKHPLDGWYKKSENNDWRPLDSKLTKIENLNILTGSRVRYYHHKKQKRALKKNKFHKLNKLRWLQTMYKKGKQEEINGVKNRKGYKEAEEDLEKILDSENFLLNDDPEIEKEAENLIKWADDLNFDKYMDDWFFKSTVFVNFDLANNPLENTDKDLAGKLRESIAKLEGQKIDHVAYLNQGDTRKSVDDGVVNEMNEIFLTSESYKYHKEQERRRRRQESILSSYSTNATKDMIVEQYEESERLEKAHQDGYENFLNVDDGFEMRRRMEKMKDADRRGYDFDFEDYQEANTEYNRFDVYKENYLKMRDTSGLQDSFDYNRSYSDYLGKSLRKFVDGLEEGNPNRKMADFYRNDEEFNSGSIHSINLHDYERTKRANRVDERDDEEVETEVRFLEEDHDDFELPDRDTKDNHNAMGYQPEYDENVSYVDVGHQPGVTFRARKEIFRQYLNGAHVRDLGNEFGLLPESVKAIIWFENYWLEHFVPFLGEKELRVMHIFEKEHDKLPNAFDYGYDMDFIRAGQKGAESDASMSFHWNSKAPSNKYDTDMEKLIKEKERSRIEVIERFHGSGKSGYFIKDLRIRRGTGKLRPGKLFEGYIRNSQVKDYLPMRSRGRDNLGPRSAVRGLGPQ